MPAAMSLPLLASGSDSGSGSDSYSGSNSGSAEKSPSPSCLNRRLLFLFLLGPTKSPMVASRFVAASCFRGALPPVDLRAVCFVRAPPRPILVGLVCLKFALGGFATKKNTYIFSRKKHFFLREILLYNSKNPNWVCHKNNKQRPQTTNSNNELLHRRSRYHVHEYQGR